MSIISLLVTLAIIGLVCWVILQIPMPTPIRNVIVGVAILFIVLWVVKALGVNLNLDF